MDLAQGPDMEKLEIRKLPASHVQKLSAYLDFDNHWKDLMARIPKQLERENFTSADDGDNRPKYNTDDMRLLEVEAKRLNKSCTQILFEEWGSSGRIRPTLGHLRYILKKAKLYIADLHIAVNILKERTPSRPTAGPAAMISISELDAEEFEGIVHGDHMEENLAEAPQPDLSCLLQDSVAIVADDATPDFSLINASVVDKPKSSKLSSESSVQSEIFSYSDLIGDSGDLHKSSESKDKAETNVLSQISIPFSELLDINSQNTAKSTNRPNSADQRSLSPNSDNIPKTLESSNYTTPLPEEQIVEGSGVLPNFSDILPSKAIACNELPHFSYTDIERATYDFTTGNGRLLGPGKIGFVHLARNLLKTPTVAVKTLNINKEQFKKDLDVISRYKHQNLLAILGYSVDGPKCCLVVEYVSGGSLRDILEHSPNKLQWRDRLKVSWHTAKGVHHLHTAFETPLIHRNLKSTNILLDSENNVKLCDFGVISNSESVYLPPEASASGYKPTEKLDVFSYGVVLLELLTLLSPNKPGGEHIKFLVMENGILPHLDPTSGIWQENNQHFGNELFKIAQICLENEPKKRKYFHYIECQIARLFRQTLLPQSI